MQSDKERYEYSMLIELFDFKELDERLAKLFNVVFENKNIFDRKVIEKGFELKSVIYNNVVTVAQRFKKQIDVMVAQQSDVENNAVLQGRIIKDANILKNPLLYWKISGHSRWILRMSLLIMIFRKHWWLCRRWCL